MIFYIGIFRCFKSKLDNFLHFSNEIVTILVYLTVCLSALNADRGSKANLTNLAIYLVGTSWAINAVVNLIKIIAQVMKLCSSCKKEKKIEPAEQIESKMTNKTISQID